MQVHIVEIAVELRKSAHLAVIMGNLALLIMYIADLQTIIMLDKLLILDKVELMLIKDRAQLFSLVPISHL